VEGQTCAKHSSLQGDWQWMGSACRAMDFIEDDMNLSHLDTPDRTWTKAPSNEVFCTTAEGLLFRLPKNSIDTFWFSPPYNLADRFRGEIILRVK
jgi:hypothetical protein